MVYTLLSVALMLLLFVYIPHGIYKEIEQQSLHSENLKIGPEINWHLDHLSQFSAADIPHRQPDFTQKFDGHTWLEKPISGIPVWLSFQISWLSETETNPVKMFVDLGFSTLNNVTFFLIDASGEVIDTQKAGDHIIMSERPLPMSHPVFPLSLQANTPSFIVLRIETDSSLNTPIAVSTAEQTLLRKHHLNFLLGIFYGCMGMVLFYNLFILILTRRLTYLYYVLYLLFLIAYQGVLDGVVGQYFWSKPSWFLDRGVVYFAGLSYVMAILFLRTILRLDYYAPRFNTWVSRVLCLLSLSFVVELVYPSNFSSIWMTISVGVISLLVPALGIVAWRQGSPLAKSYFVAWMSYPIIILVYVFSMAGIIPTSYDTLNSLRVGAMIQAILMSFALAYYISQLRVQKSSLNKAYYEGLETQIDKLSQTTMALSLGEYHVRSQIPNNARLGLLANDINALGKALEKSQIQRQHWLADLSHELRTPLTILRGSLESMQDGIFPLDAESLQPLINELIRINRLVDDLHDLSLLESNEIMLYPRKVDVAELINTVIVNDECRLKKRAIKVSVEVKSPHVMVYLDIDRLQQVLVNLMNNTLKYTNSPGTLIITVDQVDNYCLIRWEDSSPGVAPEELSHIFSRLYRSDLSRSRRSSGAGLGLALCYSIIRNSGGNISACSSSLGGIQIEIQLPTMQMKESPFDDSRLSDKKIYNPNHILYE